MRSTPPSNSAMTRNCGGSLSLSLGGKPFYRFARLPSNSLAPHRRSSQGESPAQHAVGRVSSLLFVPANRPIVRQREMMRSTGTASESSLPERPPPSQASRLETADRSWARCTCYLHRPLARLFSPLGVMVSSPYRCHIFGRCGLIWMFLSSQCSRRVQKVFTLDGVLANDNYRSVVHEE